MPSSRSHSSSSLTRRPVALSHAGPGPCVVRLHTPSVFRHSLVCAVSREVTSRLYRVPEAIGTSPLFSSSPKSEEGCSTLQIISPEDRICQDARLFAHFVRINGPPAASPAQHRHVRQGRTWRPPAPCRPPHPRKARIGPLRVAGSRWRLRSQPGLAPLSLIDCVYTCHSLMPGSHSLAHLTQRR